MGTKLRTKREIHSLDYAISKLMVFLDMLFFSIEGWQTIHSGIDIEIITDEENNNGKVVVNIHPVGWPKESYIIAIFYSVILPSPLNNTWILEEAIIFASHVETLDFSLDIMLDDIIYPNIKSRSSYTDAHRTIAQCRINMCKRMEELIG